MPDEWTNGMVSSEIQYLRAMSVVWWTQQAIFLVSMGMAERQGILIGSCRMLGGNEFDVDRRMKFPTFWGLGSTGRQTQLSEAA